MTSICTCPMCRKSIRQAIIYTFHVHRRWIGFYTIRFLANLGWVPIDFYRDVIDEMLRLGLLIKTGDPSDDFPRFLLTALAVPVLASRRGGVEA